MVGMLNITETKVTLQILARLVKSSINCPINDYNHHVEERKSEI